MKAELTFVNQSRAKLKSLSGWKKNDRIPDRVGDFNQALVARCAAEELKKDLDDIYGKLKDAFGFTRRELTAAEPNDGTGTIITPHFSYSIIVVSNPEQLDEVIWTRTVDAIKTPSQISSPAFASVFDGVFNTLAFGLPCKISVEDFIDEVECAKIPELSIKYDREATYCDLQLPEATGVITLRPEMLSIVHKQRTETQALLRSFDLVRRLVEDYKLSPVSFDAG